MTPARFAVCACVASALAWSSSAQSVVSYEGHAVWRLRVTSEDAHAVVANATRTFGADLWAESATKEGDVKVHTVDIRVAPDMAQAFAAAIDHANVTRSIKMPNVGAVIREQQEQRRKNKALKAKSASGGGANKSFVELDVTKYHDIQDVYPWLEDLPRQYPALAQRIVIGTSILGRPIVAIKISTGGVGVEKPALWLDGGIHAREWISPATVIWMLDAILKGAYTDGDIASMLRNADLYVIPHFNPDGYEYSWNFDRLWRKNRRINNAGGICFGVDLNRNWDYEWDGPGSSTNPCSDSYRGPEPFSEPETTQVSTYIKEHPRIQGYLNFHAYSQLWMSPWGYTDRDPPDIVTMAKVSKDICDAIRKVHGTTYQYGTISNIIYPASGSSVDYTYGALGIVQSYGVELRDLGQYGFMLPESQIVPSGQETIESLYVMVNAIVIGQAKK